jgi:hypothetical protein
MFAHCVAGNIAEVVVPWNKFAGHANSLFLFRIVVGLAGIVVVGLPIALVVVSIIALCKAAVIGLAISGIVVAVLAFIGTIILFGLIAKLTTDFVVPIMLLNTASCVAGWRMFLAILGANKARIALYILFQIVISMVIGFIATTICLVTCCCCCCLLVLFVLPYIGTVILLPLFAFQRAYSLYYLRQFGPAFDVFSVQAP